MSNPSVGDKAKYAAERVMEPILRVWFGYDSPPHDVEHHAENAAVDLSWALEGAGLLTSAAPVPEGVPEDRIVPEGWRVEWPEIKPGHENCVLCIRWSKVPTLVPVSPSVDPEEE